LNTVTYGLAPSSFLATRTLLQLADDEGASFPVAASALKSNFYVDDFIGGADSVEGARRLRVELAALLFKGGFDLRKWTSNQLMVLDGLNADQIGTQSARQFLPHETVKTLGVSWEPEHDILSFESAIEPESSTLTKRSILSNVARMFDPLGLISPIVIRAKIMMQELWSQNAGWDDPSIATHFYLVLVFSCIPFAMLLKQHIEPAFTRAAKVNKGKVAPLKRVTLPRLELCAAVLGADLHHRVKKAMRIDAAESFFWSDSTITLTWLSETPNTWATFVVNRVSELQHYTNPRLWRHVPSSSNPADLVSRGMSAAEFLKSKLWGFGPDWLALSPSHWPNTYPEPVDETNLEIRQVSTAVMKMPLCSSFKRLLHIVAYCIRFTRNSKEKARTQQTTICNPIPFVITPEDMAAANTVLCRLAQQDAFSTELLQLQKGNDVTKQSPLRTLNPFLDQQGSIRLGGRLRISQLPYQAKHPVLLHKKHPIAQLICRLLLSRVREECWPLDGRHLVKGIVRNCFRCVRQQPTLEQQPLGQLPAQRITPSRPFSVTKVDYAGLLYLKPAHKRVAPGKSYLCVFVCFSTKAVHLELVGDLTTAGFFAALHRFTARRGLPAHILSDNGKNFEGAERELHELFAMFRDEQQLHQIATDSANRGISWHFIPPKAPHFGGLWEAALGSTRLSYEGYTTIIQQSEAAMNSRPLLPMSDDPNDQSALTPAHFLIGTSMHAVLEPVYSHLRSCTLKVTTERFWKHWTAEYLQEMQWDNSKLKRNDNIILGRLVILKDDFLHPTRWPLARIILTHSGEDKLIRVVTLKTTKGIVTRPIPKICVLPLADNPINGCTLLLF
uniref:Integrase catalytic domain-containing protein n=1 Tax=Anopheles christyi TaxID=43041 RepID=A0A182KHE2_9DIPT